MARRTLVWHIGPDDPGTAFLAEALHARSDELAALDIATPQGRWHEIEDQVWRHKGLSLLSTPDVARANDDRIGLRLSGLRDVEVHLVLLVRDLPSQVHAGWQAAVRRGSTTALPRYAARVLDPERSHWQAEEFWAGRELADFLPRWTRAIHADRVHVVATGPGPDQVWRDFLQQAAVGGLERPDVFVPPTLAAALDTARVLDVTTRWAKLVAERGFDQHGSLISASLAAAPADEQRQLEALADLLTASAAELDRLTAEVGALRVRNARLDRKRRKHKRRLAELLAGTG